MRDLCNANAASLFRPPMRMELAGAILVTYRKMIG
jgi:hypothetical protein